MNKMDRSLAGLTERERDRETETQRERHRGEEEREEENQIKCYRNSKEHRTLRILF
jgi:hypothetical protein